MIKNIDKILIITSEPPDAKNANRIWINQILNKLNNHIFWFSTKGPYDERIKYIKKSHIQVAFYPKGRIDQV